ncbi:MAG: hypothetical protein AABY15_06825 [Nanoarchaeota archaeon]
MDIKEVVKEIKAMPQMKGFEFHKEFDATNASAFLRIEPKQFKDKNGNEYRLGGTYHLFIAHMYAGQKGKEFFYMTLSRKSQLRFFRKHRFDDIEHNKIYSSGNTVKKLMKSFKGYFTKCNYQLDSDYGI